MRLQEVADVSSVQLTHRSLLSFHQPHYHYDLLFNSSISVPLSRIVNFDLCTPAVRSPGASGVYRVDSLMRSGPRKKGERPILRH